MAVVRIEVDFDVPLEGGVESAGSARVELDDPGSDPAELLDRAELAMLQLLPQKTTQAPELQTVLTLNNVKFSQADQGVLFGRAGEMRPPTQQVEAVKERGQCQSHCPTDEAGHPPCRCELPSGHESKHRALSSGHGWPQTVCQAMCDWGDCIERCERPPGHYPRTDCACADHLGTEEGAQCAYKRAKAVLDEDE